MKSMEDEKEDRRGRKRESKMNSEIFNDFWLMIISIVMMGTLIIPIVINPSSKT